MLDAKKVPQTFIQLVKYFFSDAKTIEEYWHMVQIAAFRFDCQHEADDILTLSIQAFKQLIRKLKSTKLVKKPIAFFYGILINKLKEHFLKKLFENRTESMPHNFVLETGGVLYYDWLQA